MDSEGQDVETDALTSTSCKPEHLSARIKPKRLTEADYAKLPREELIDEVRRLHAHVKQLKALLEQSGADKKLDSCNDARLNKRGRTFDFDKFNKRHVLLKFAYLGWDYHGFQTQEANPNTVENVIFKALECTKLIVNRQTSNYHRCGRTDKGVSAFCQVISIDLRSNCAEGVGVVKTPNSGITNTDIDKEINYMKLLNGVLPHDIRMLAWAPVNEDFSSRFDCNLRIYRYYFPKGDLDLEAMQIAASKFVGEHDFRNFCRMDVSNGVVQFFRRMEKITINLLGDPNDIYSMVEIIIEGSSFLWHQIRSMMSVLFIIGQHKEEPSIIDDLLDVTNWPCKPAYNISSELPLILFDCQYANLEWLYDRVNLDLVIKKLQDQWADFSLKSIMIKRMVDSLEDRLNTLSPGKSQYNVTDKKVTSMGLRTLQQPYYNLEGKSHSVEYVKFKKRKVVKSLEARVDYFIKRKKIDPNIVSEKLSEANLINKTLEEKYKNNKKNDNDND